MAAEEVPQELGDASQQLVDNLLVSSQVEHYGPEYQDAIRQSVLPGSEMEPSQLGLVGPAGLATTANLYQHNHGDLANIGYHLMGMGGNLGPPMYMHPHSMMLDPGVGMPYPQQPTKHPSLQKPEHEDSRAKRRGPMDEMRQLVRIMVKFLPQSLSFLSTSDEPGGGNRVTEPQIKQYLKATLGDEAPQPTWGMPNGWGAYLSDLFTWALGRLVTDDEARSCACRQQGRSWQVKETRLAELGIFAYAWPLPLTQEGVAQAQLNPGNPPRGTSFIGPPPGWPFVDAPAALVASPGAVARPRGRLTSDDEDGQIMQAQPRPARPVAVHAPTRLMSNPVMPADRSHEPVVMTELECVQDALQLVLAATSMCRGPNEEVLAIVDKIQGLLGATYGSPLPVLNTTGLGLPTSGLGLAPSGADTPRVRASPAKGMLAQAQQRPDASPLRLQPPQHPHAAIQRAMLASKLSAKSSLQPTMEDLVSAAMKHCKANGELITPSETEEHTTTSEPNARKRRKRTAREEGEGWEEGEEEEAHSGLGGSQGRRRGKRALVGAGGQFGEADGNDAELSFGVRRASPAQGAVAGSRRARLETAGEEDEDWQEAVHGGAAGGGRLQGGDGADDQEYDNTWNDAGGVAAGSLTAVRQSEVSRLRSTLYQQIQTGGGPPVESSVRRGPSVPVAVNGFAVAGDDMLPLGNLPVSSRQRSTSHAVQVGMQHNMGAARRGRQPTHV